MVISPELLSRGPLSAAKCSDIAVFDQEKIFIALNVDDILCGQRLAVGAIADPVSATGGKCHAIADLQVQQLIITRFAEVALALSDNMENALWAILKLQVPWPASTSANVGFCRQLNGFQYVSQRIHSHNFMTS